MARYAFPTKAAFEQHFRETILPVIRESEHNGVDRIMRREEWNNAVDAVVNDSEAPPRAVEWMPPW